MEKKIYVPGQALTPGKLVSQLEVWDFALVLGKLGVFSPPQDVAKKLLAPMRSKRDIPRLFKERLQNGKSPVSFRDLYRKER